MKQKPISPSHFPELDIFLQTPAQAIALGQVSLKMAHKASNGALPALEQHDSIAAYGLTDFAEYCYREANDAAQRATELIDHEQCHDCVPDDCRDLAYLAQARKLLQNLPDFVTKNHLLQAETSARSKSVPITQEEVDEASANVQMEIRLAHAREISKDLEDHQGRLNAEERYAAVLVLEYLALNPSGRPHEFCNHEEEETPLEDSDQRQAKQEQAYQDQRAIMELYSVHSQRANEAMTVELSPSLKDVPKLRTWLEDSHRWLAVPEAGVHLSRVARRRLHIMDENLRTGGYENGQHTILDASELDPENGERLNAFTSFVHGGKRHVKDLRDPFPKNFPQGTALHHIRLAQDAIHQLEHQDDFPATAVCLLHQMAQDAANLAHANIHDIPPENLDAIAETAERNGATPGTVAMIMSVATADNARSVAPERGKSHRWWQREATQHQAEDTISAARKIGLDHNALTSIANALGYRAHELGIKQENLSEEAIDKIIDQAKEAGLDEQSLTHMGYMLRG